MRRTHRSVLATLAVCAVITALQTLPAEDPPPARGTTLLAIGLALGTVVLRRLSTSPVMAVRTRVGMLISSYVLAVGLGLVGALIGITQSAVRTGLIFILAAAIFCLLPPPSFATPPPAPEGGGT